MGTSVRRRRGIVHGIGVRNNICVFSVDGLELISRLAVISVISGLSTITYLLPVSMVDGLAASRPPSQVLTETCGSDISCSGRVSGSGSNCISGTTLIPRPSRARDLVIIAEVGSA